MQRILGSSSRARGASPAVLLALSLLILCGYAVFEHGAIEAPAEPRLQVAVIVVALLVAPLLLWSARLKLVLRPQLKIALALLAAFAVWGAVSTLWSIAPNLSWLEFNREASYVLFLGLGLVLGASFGRAVELTVGGLLVLGALVTLDALAQKLIPGVHLGGFVNFDQTGTVARLQNPLGYWNALALFLALLAPLAASLAASPELARPIRMACCVLLELVLVTIVFTYSRGGLLALAVGLLVCAALAREPLRVALWTGASLIAAIPGMAFGLTSHALTANGASLSAREHAGLLLLILVVGCSTLLWLSAERLLAWDRRIRSSTVMRRGWIRALVALLLAAGIILLAAFALSAGGSFGSFSRIWSSVAGSGGVGNSNPSRLISADLTGRLHWWGEAIRAFAQRPLEGWGAGAFPAIDLLFRRDPLTAQHAHSMPLQALAETGAVGLLLIAASWLLLLRGALFSARQRTTPGARLPAAALFAVAVAYSVHFLYDWDWDIPGVTLPAILCLGVLCGSARVERGSEAPLRPLEVGLRLVGLSFVTISLCTLMLSSVLPALAASDASAALVASAGATRNDLLVAARDASASNRLDPLSDQGSLAQAALAERRGDLRLARAYLLEGLHREPADTQAWASLAEVDLQLRAPGQAMLAAQRLTELDPFSGQLRTLAENVAEAADLDRVPPGASATRSPTPVTPTAP